MPRGVLVKAAPFAPRLLTEACSFSKVWNEEGGATVVGAFEMSAKSFFILIISVTSLTGVLPPGAFFEETFTSKCLTLIRSRWSEVT
jgi:hypothetical protein